MDSINKMWRNFTAVVLISWIYQKNIWQLIAKQEIGYITWFKEKARVFRFQHASRKRHIPDVTFLQTFFSEVRYILMSGVHTGTTLPLRKFRDIAVQRLVCYTAVFSVVTQCWVADYSKVGLIRAKISNGSVWTKQPVKSFSRSNSQSQTGQTAKSEVNYLI